MCPGQDIHPEERLMKEELAYKGKPVDAWGAYSP